MVHFFTRKAGLADFSPLCPKCIFPAKTERNRQMKQFERDRMIIRTGSIGILVNILLAIFKMLVGLISNSISILLDAVNNLSDALSSVITILGIKLSAKPADKKHPLGYGRIEYLSTMLISGIVLFAGATSFIESVKKILSPEKTNYSVPSLLIIAVAIVVKVLLGKFTKNRGIQTDSDSLVASGSDAMFDAVISLTTLIGAAITLLWKVNIDGWLGALISVVIVKAGFEMLAKTLDDILGKRIDSQVAHEIKKEILLFDDVQGVFDLYLDSYGPQKLAGSVHIEVRDTMTASQIDELTRKITGHIYKKFNTVVTCGIYAVQTQDERQVQLRESITKRILNHKGVLQVHGFHIDEKDKIVFFDVVRDFSIQDGEALTQEINTDLTNYYPQYQYVIAPDLDYSD